MSNQRLNEIIKALAYGESAEQVAEAEGVEVSAVQQIVIDDAAEREVLKKAGYLRASAAGPPREGASPGEAWIDVSAHQGVIDWKKVAAAGIKGAVIRAGYGDDVSQTDTQFAANLRGAATAGLKVCIYWFSYADSVQDARAEWETCKRVIEPYRSDILLVACDYEYDSVSYYERIHGAAPGNALVNRMVAAFLAAARGDGWKTALYTNNDYRLHVFTAATLAAADYLWLADYTGGPDVPCAMQQTGSTGRVDGISGNVDMDTAFSPIADPVADPPYQCDTSGAVEIARGSAYQIEVTCAFAPKVVAGTGDELTILPRSNSGVKWYYYLVPIGKRGDEVGVYINGGPRQLVVKIK